MHILLPPSETKHSGGQAYPSIPALPFADALESTRTQVRAALDDLMTDREVATKALKLGVRSQGELEHNLQLNVPLLVPAIERYTGVLFDALSVTSLSAESRAWVDAHVSIQSALFGLISADARIPAYRLSASTRLPNLAGPLKKVWGRAHADISWSQLGWILDLRSKDYAALAPVPVQCGVFVEVLQRDAQGQVKSLNHFNKAAKGHFVRHLAESQADFDGVSALTEWALAKGIECELSTDKSVLSLVFPTEINL